MKRRRRPGEPAAIEMLEEAAHLLRSVPSSVPAAYLLGTAPFLVGSLYFVAEMSRGAQAGRHLAGAAWVMVILFGWMKAWQAIAAGQALAHLAREALPLPGFLGFVRVFVQQLRVHAAGLVLGPAALVAAIPFAWVYAYYQNAVVLQFASGPRLHRASLEQARIWPRQNHLVLALLGLMTLVVFVNVAVAVYAVPALLRVLLGLDNLFATSGWNPLNTTFLGVAGGLTYLVVDPFCKAVYVLRCFHGAARRTGLDLLVQVRAVAGRGSSVFVMTLLLAWAGMPSAPAAESRGRVEPVVDEGGAAMLQPSEIDAAISRMLEHPRHAWRLPRVEGAGDVEAPGLIARFFVSVLDVIKQVARWLGEMIEMALDFFLRRDGTDPASTPGGGGIGRLLAWLRLLLPLLAAGLLLAVGWLAWRWWSQSRRRPSPAASPAVVPLLEQENLPADALPEDEWMRLGRDLLARGETRLALRAFFLGSLAALGTRGALLLARHKSNRDYERELGRRGASDQEPDLAAVFAENRRLLERAWYGWHETMPEDVERFSTNVERLRAAGGDRA